MNMGSGKSIPAVSAGAETFPSAIRRAGIKAASPAFCANVLQGGYAQAICFPSIFAVPAFRLPSIMKQLPSVHQLGLSGQG